MPNGKLKFPKRWRAIAVEFGWLSPDNEKIDYNDAVVLVKGECLAKPEMVIFDRIGADYSLSEGLRHYDSNQNPVTLSTYVMAPVEFSISKSTALTVFENVGTKVNIFGFVGIPAGWDYRLLLWSSLDKAKSAPLAPDVLDYTFADATLSQEVVSIGMSEKPNQRMAVDISSLDITLEPGDYVIGLMIQTLPGSFGSYRIAESAQDGPSDTFFGTPNASSIFGSQGWILAENVVNASTGRFSYLLCGKN
jgi:hypothetical protein